MKYILVLLLMMIGCGSHDTQDKVARDRHYTSGNILDEDNVVIGRWESVIMDNAWTGDFKWIKQGRK